MRFIILCASLAFPAHAERRFALLVGANDGWATDRPLRYAHDDARRVQEVLIQLGQLAAADSTLLLEPTTGELDAALKRIEAQLSLAQEPTFLFFFYSGHADASALHLRGPALELTALADRLAASKAGLTLAVVDACRSGAILGAKGANSVPAVRMLADEPVQGFALLSSSGADELAQESKALAGSIFTHHWVSGLRGAADVDSDGVVRLSEAYAYAYERTRLDTESSALPQSPRFRFALKGQGDVPLTRLIRAAATLELEVEPSHRYVVVDSGEQHLIAEARSHPSERRRLQLAPGSYRIKRPVSDGVMVAEVTMSPGSVLWAQRLDYRKEALETGLIKGSSAFAEWAASGTLAQGDIGAALNMFQRMLDEDPHEMRARRGKARALLAQASELRKAGNSEGAELKALEEALGLDPSFAEDPSVARFAERAKFLKFETQRHNAIKKAVADEILNDPRVTRRWGLGLQLVSTKGIFVVEGHWMPMPWLTVSLGVDLIGPGVDLSVRWVPLPSPWSPFVAAGGHYGFDAWARKSSSVYVDGQRQPLSYDDIWGKMFHADLGMQWMSPGGFTVEFGGGPMLYYSPRGVFEWFGFFSLGLGWYFR